MLSNFRIWIALFTLKLLLPLEDFFNKIQLSGIRTTNYFTKS